MKYIVTLLFFIGLLSANDKAHTFASSKDCKACHVEIYKEFSGSMHTQSTPQKDPIHNAVWSKHPAKNKKQHYGCGKCHTPAADNLDAMLSKKEKVLPLADNSSQQEGISCAYCHRIKDIEIHKKHNTNIINPQEKNYFGTREKHIDSPYHAITTEGNQHIKNGNVCIGCHSHKMNKHQLNVCSTNIDNEMDGANCVSCHMPQVKGSVSNLHKTQKHAFHGFAGSHFHSDMLTQYVDLTLKNSDGNFTVSIQNKSSHALLLHPLRTAVLKVNVLRAGKTIKLHDEIFVRVIGHKGKPAMPWKADVTLKDTMIQGKEKRDVLYDFALQKGDKVNIVLGWYLVNPKALKLLNLKDVLVATEFKEFKKKSFSF